MQPKLVIGPVDDPLEHEADRVADLVMRIPDPDVPLTAGPAKTLQSTSSEPSDAATDRAPRIVHEALCSPGQPLDAETRSFFEPRFGHDFGHVRVHADSKAVASAHSVGALAYTVGEHVAFGSSQYSPQTASGRRLLAHELAHVVQQTRGCCDLSRVRVHPDAVGARAYSVDEPVAFAKGQYTPNSRAGQFLLAQELVHPIPTHASAAPSFVLQRAPAAKPPAPNIDQIVQEIGAALGGPYNDYPAYAAAMVQGSFLGHAISQGVRSEFLAKLHTAQTEIDAEYAKSGNPKPSDYGIRSVGGFRSREGPHGWGLAIDIDSAENPFLMHESSSNPAKEAGERKLDKQLIPVYNRIAEFVLNDPITLPPPLGGPHQSVIPVLITKTGSSLSGGQLQRDARWAEYYDRLKRESDAMKKYFELMRGTEQERDTYMKNDWKGTHPTEPEPDHGKMLKQMWEDYAALGGLVPDAGPPGVQDYQKPESVAPGDRPFKGTADPAKGFLTIPREVVRGLGRVLTRWGAIDFGGESGDVMHFDDMGGLGMEIGRARNAAQAKITSAAATGSPAAAAPATPDPTSGIGSTPNDEAGTAIAAIDASKSGTATSA